MKKYRYIVVRCAKRRSARALVDSARRGIPPGVHRATLCCFEDRNAPHHALRAFLTRAEARDMAKRGNAERPSANYKVFRVTRIA